MVIGDVRILRAKQKPRAQQQALVIAREQVQAAPYELIHLPNLPSATTLTLSKSEKYVIQLYVGKGSSIEEAHLQRPEMIALKSRMEAAQRDLAGAYGERLSSVSVRSSWNEQGNRPDNIFPLITAKLDSQFLSYDSPDRVGRNAG